MSYHIRVCEVDDDHIVFFRTDSFGQLVAYFICTHLRFQIVSSYFRGFYQNAVFAFVRFFYSAVEEEGNVCIFFCLGDSCLCHVMCCQEFTEGICDRNFVECYFFIRNRLIVLCEAYISQIQSLFSCESVKLICTECTGDLSCTVRTEIEEDYRIFVFDCCNRCSAFLNNSRNYELIVLSVVVRILYCTDAACCFCTFAFYHSIVSQLYTIPAVVTIHCIVTSHNSCNLSDADLFHFINELFYIAFA